MLCQMNEPFLPTYDFDDIPTDEELAAKDTVPDWIRNAQAPAPFPFPFGPKGTIREQARKDLDDYLNSNDVVPPVTLKRIDCVSYKYDAVTDCLVLNDKYEVPTEDWKKALELGMTVAEIYERCEVYAKGEIL